MADLRTAAQQALEFVTSKQWGTTPYMDVRVYEDAARLRDALRKALEQTEHPRRLTDDEIGQIWFAARIPGLTESDARRLIRAAEDAK